MADPVIRSIAGAQEKHNCDYRWSRYVLRKENAEGLLLYNTLTCQLVFFPSAEKDDLLSCETLLRGWFLVPQDFDEYSFARRIKRLRQLVYKAEEKKNRTLPIDRYWILTTTNCNARCFYCHENGIPHMHMTPRTADDIVRYIQKHCAGQPVQLMWYGGEPLVNERVIDQITRGLQEKGIAYSGKMISNGYLFDADSAKKAAALWQLRQIQITLDGMEETYNRIKAYPHSAEEGSPFVKVLDNISLLLDNRVNVQVRLNIDSYNREELFSLADLLIGRFGGRAGFSIYSAPLLEDCLGTDHTRTQAQRQEVYAAHHALSEKLNCAGVLLKTELARAMRSEMRCIAVSNVRVIFPDGQLAFCHDYTDGILSGSIYGEEPQEQERIAYTQCLPEKAECAECVKFPQCVRLAKCFNNHCNAEMVSEWIWTTQNEMQWAYEQQFPADGAKKATAE